MHGDDSGRETGRKHNVAGQLGTQNAVIGIETTARDQNTVRLWVKEQQMRGTRCCGSCFSSASSIHTSMPDDDSSECVDPMGHEASHGGLAKRIRKIQIWVVVAQNGEPASVCNDVRDDMGILLYAADRHSGPVRTVCHTRYVALP